jgi:hypothetical protein
LRRAQAQRPGLVHAAGDIAKYCFSLPKGLIPGS